VKEQEDEKHYRGDRVPADGSDKTKVNHDIVTRTEIVNEPGDNDVERHQQEQYVGPRKAAPGSEPRADATNVSPKRSHGATTLAKMREHEDREK
jgi:hypothetical protein